MSGRSTLKLSGLLALIVLVLSATNVRAETFKSHFLWGIYESNLNDNKERTYRHFIREGVLARNTLVFTCPKSRGEHPVIEVIPPKSILPKLRSLTSERPIVFGLTVGNKTLTMPGSADSIAGWIVLNAFNDRPYNPNPFEFLDADVVTVAFKEEGGGLSSTLPEYRIEKSFSAGKYIEDTLSHPDTVNKFGRTIWVSASAMYSSCIDYRK